MGLRSVTRALPNRSDSHASIPATEEVSGFLQHMHDLNKSIAVQVSPLLEKAEGIDLRLYFMLHVMRSGTAYPSAIAQACHLPNSLVTKHLDQLAEKNLVERNLDPTDSRRVRLSLTDEGAKVLRRSDEIILDSVGKRLAKIPADRRRDFLATLIDLTRETSGA